MGNRIATMILLLLTAALLTACPAHVVWKDRQAAEPGNASATTPLAHCPHCDQYVDWEADRCANPECAELVRWMEPTEQD